MKFVCNLCPCKFICLLFSVWKKKISWSTCGGCWRSCWRRPCWRFFVVYFFAPLFLYYRLTMSAKIKWSLCVIFARVNSFACCFLFEKKKISWSTCGGCWRSCWRHPCVSRLAGVPWRTAPALCWWPWPWSVSTHFSQPAWHRHAKVLQWW